MTEDIEALAARFEQNEDVGLDAIEEARSLLAKHLADNNKDHAISDADIQSTDAVIHLIDALVPGWSIHIRGRAIEPNGHWHCHLRRSEGRDNDEFIGLGKGRTLSQALIAALLRTVAYLIGRKQIA